MAAQQGALFIGVSSLCQQLDKKVLVILRDGRHLVGMLRTYDQFSNVVLEHTVERHIANGKVADLQLGLFVIRGENMVMLAEIDEARDKYVTETVLEPADIADVLAEERAADEAALAKKMRTSKTKWAMEDET